MLASLLLSPLVSLAIAAELKASASVKLTEVVEVPLYAGPDRTDPFWYVNAQIGEKNFLLRLATGHERFILSEAGAKKAGLKVREAGDKKTASAKEVTVGTMKLASVKVSVETPESDRWLVDGELGLAGLAGVAWAVLPSQGKVRFGPAEKGAEMVAGVGAPLPYTTFVAGKKEHVGESDIAWWSEPYIVSVAFSGVSIPTELVSQVSPPTLSREAEAASWFHVKGTNPVTYKLPPAPSYVDTETTVEWREITVAGASLSAPVHRFGYGIAAVRQANAQLGANILRQFDLAVDPMNHELALKRIDAPQAQDWAEIAEADFRKALDTPPAVPKAKTPPDAEAERKRKAGAQGALATFLYKRGRAEEALDLRKQAADATPDKCEAWIAYGASALALGQAAAAADAFQRAGDLYGVWSVQPLDVRKKRTAEHEKAKPGAWEGPIPQSNACHTAWSGLANARLLTRDYAGIAALYPAKLDLDEGLSTAAGSAFLFQKQYAEATSAFQQSVKLTEGDWPSRAREGLMLAYKRADAARAVMQVDPAVDGIQHISDVALYVWGDAAREVYGASEAAKRLATLAESHPDSAEILTEAARAARLAGDAAGADALLQRAIAAARSDAIWFPRSQFAQANLAHALVLAGNVEEAAAAADAAMRLTPFEASALLAKADVSDARGDVAGGNALRHRAGAAFIEDPAYAMLLLRGESDADLTAPPPPPVEPVAPDPAPPVVPEPTPPPPKDKAK